MSGNTADNPYPPMKWAPVIHGSGKSGYDLQVCPELPPTIKEWVKDTIYQKTFLNDEKHIPFTLAKRGEWTLVGINAWPRHFIDDQRFWREDPKCDDKGNLIGSTGRPAHAIECFFLAKGPLTELPKTDEEALRQYVETYREFADTGPTPFFRDKAHAPKKLPVISHFDRTIAAEPIANALAIAAPLARDEYFFPERKGTYQHPPSEENQKRLWALAATSQKPVITTIGGHYDDGNNIHGPHIPNGFAAEGVAIRTTRNRHPQTTVYFEQEMQREMGEIPALPPTPRIPTSRPSPAIPASTVTSTNTVSSDTTTNNTSTVAAGLAAVAASAAAMTTQNKWLTVGLCIAAPLLLFDGLRRLLAKQEEQQAANASQTTSKNSRIMAGTTEVLGAFTSAVFAAKRQGYLIGGDETMSGNTADNPYPPMQWAPVIYGSGQAGFNLQVCPDLPPAVKEWVTDILIQQSAFLGVQEGKKILPFTLAKRGEWTFVGVTAWPQHFTNDQRFWDENPKCDDKGNLIGSTGRPAHAIKCFFLTKGPLTELPRTDEEALKQYLETYMEFADRGATPFFRDGAHAPKELPVISHFDRTIPSEPIANAITTARTIARDAYFSSGEEEAYQHPPSDQNTKRLWALTAVSQEPVIATIGGHYVANNIQGGGVPNSFVAEGVTTRTTIARYPMIDGDIHDQIKRKAHYESMGKIPALPAAPRISAPKPASLSYADTDSRASTSTPSPAPAASNTTAVAAGLGAAAAGIAAMSGQNKWLTVGLCIAAPILLFDGLRRLLAKQEEQQAANASQTTSKNSRIIVGTTEVLGAFTSAVLAAKTAGLFNKR